MRMDFGRRRMGSGTTDQANAAAGAGRPHSAARKEAASLSASTWVHPPFSPVHPHSWIWKATTMRTPHDTSSGPMAALLRGLLILVICASSGFALLATSATPAAALCTTPAIEGAWHNIDGNTRSITRASLRMVDCGDQVLCDENGNCTNTQTKFAVQLFGKCHPQDCDWGQVVGPQRNDGWVQVTYDFGFKTSYVWLKTYSYYGNTYLRVYVDNQFAPGDGRADYVTDEWFLK